MLVVDKRVVNAGNPFPSPRLPVYLRDLLQTGMIRSATLFVGSLLFAVATSGQRNVEIGLAQGVTTYFGDLGNEEGAIQWGSIRPGMAVTFRDFLTNRKRYITRAVTMEGRFSWHRIGYNEADPVGGLSGMDLRNYRRGLNFRTDLYGLSVHAVLNAYREPYQPLFKQKFFAYFYIGLGVFYGRPKADLFRGEVDPANRYYFWEDGTVRNAPRGTPESDAAVIEQDGKPETDLFSWITEGSTAAGEGTVIDRLSPWHIGIPMGMGVRYMVTRKLSIGMEFSYYSFFTDQLDGVSDRYASYTELEDVYSGDVRAEELARYISDPTGWGTTGEIDDPRTSVRGNPALPDGFSYLNLEVSYKFKRGPGRSSFITF